MSAATAWGDWKTPREALDERRIQGEFHIYYTLKGANGFPGASSYSQRAGQVNGILDQLVAQFDRANRYYSAGLGLVPPLKNLRYRDVRSIDVQIIDLGREMGTTGDGAVTYRYLNFDAAAPAITISLSNRWKPPNLTPSHELFHAYQYGYTYFKTSWFLEGMARSMESAFRDMPPKSEPLPGDEAAMQQIMSRSYGADVFWNRLMQLCDPACKPGSADASRQPHLCGGAFIRTLLEQYQSIDDRAALDRGLDPHDWPEREQRSKRNDPYLILGLRRSVESQCPIDQSLELRKFDSLLKEIDPL